jgi:hypothetical protein
MTSAGQDWEEKVAAVWAGTASQSDVDVVEAISVLAAERSPDDAAALFERASAFDYAGREAEAEPLYRAALAAGLDERRRAQAVIQLASTVRTRLVRYRRRQFGCRDRTEPMVEVTQHGILQIDRDFVGVRCVHFQHVLWDAVYVQRSTSSRAFQSCSPGSSTAVASMPKQSWAIRANSAAGGLFTVVPPPRVA